MAGVYDATRALPPTVADSVADRLARMLGSERTLEIGVGTARWARPLEIRGADVVGVDLAGEMLRVARAKGFGRPLQADARRLPFRDGTFEGVLSNHVLHLVDDVPAVLREVGRVSRGFVRSILEHDTERPDVVAEYRERVGREGVPVDPPGLTERKLVEVLAPDRLRDAARFFVRSPAETRLAAIGTRAFQYTWAAPAEVHDRVVRELTTEFAGSEVTTETRVEIAEWSMPRIRSLAWAGVETSDSTGERIARSNSTASKPGGPGRHSVEGL